MSTKITEIVDKTVHAEWCPVKQYPGLVALASKKVRFHRQRSSFIPHTAGRHAKLSPPANCISHFSLNLTTGLWKDQRAATRRNLRTILDSTQWDGARIDRFHFISCPFYQFGLVVRHQEWQIPGRHYCWRNSRRNVVLLQC